MKFGGEYGSKNGQCPHLEGETGVQFNWGKNPGENPGENPDENPGENLVKKLQ